VYGVLHERDWRSAGRGLDRLGLDALSVDEIRRYVQTGDASAAVGTPLADVPR
jgi:hypothetical protein